MANEAIKTMAKEKGVKLWQIADAIGITDSNFSRMLRKELPEDKQNRITAIIVKIAEEVKHGSN